MGKATVQYGLFGSIRTNGGKTFSIFNVRVVCSWFYFTPHPTQSLAAQGVAQGSGTGKEGVFPSTGESRGCRECSAPTSVTLDEGDIHVRSVGTGVVYQITRIGSRIIMG